MRVSAERRHEWNGEGCGWGEVRRGTVPATRHGPCGEARSLRSLPPTVPRKWGWVGSDNNRKSVKLTYFIETTTNKMYKFFFYGEEKPKVYRFSSPMTGSANSSTHLSLQAETIESETTPA